MFKNLIFTDKVSTSGLNHHLISKNEIKGLDISCDYIVFVAEEENGDILNTDIEFSDNRGHYGYLDGGFQTKMTIQQAKEFCNNHFKNVCQEIYNSIME